MDLIEVQAKLDQIPKGELLSNIVKIKIEKDALESDWIPRGNVSGHSFTVLLFTYNLTDIKSNFSFRRRACKISLELKKRGKCFR